MPIPDSTQINILWGLFVIIVLSAWYVSGIHRALLSKSDFRHIKALPYANSLGEVL